MSGTSFHLAQYNIAPMRYALDDPRMAGFVARLEELNHLAEEAPGFVWRHQTETGDSTSVRPYEDDRIIINMSVWETIEDLHAYTYRSRHVEAFRTRRDWFEPTSGASLVLWWVLAGHRPSPEEGVERLEYLRQHGPSPHAFTFKARFQPPNDTIDHDGGMEVEA